MLSQRSSISCTRHCHKQAQYFRRAIISNMSKTRKNLKPYSYIKMWTPQNILLTHNKMLWCQANEFVQSYSQYHFITAFSQRLSRNVFLTTFFTQRLFHIVAVTYSSTQCSPHNVTINA